MKKIGVILSILTVLTLSFITNKNVSAASVTCSNPSPDGSARLYAFTCDTSSLNSSSTWYYQLDMSYNFTSGTNYLALNTSGYNLNFPNAAYLFNTTGAASGSGSFITSDFGTHYTQFVVGSGTFYNSLTFNSFKISDTLDNGIIPEGTFDVVANGTYDVTNYASVDVQVEESSFIVQLFSQGFWGVATAIVTIIVPIIALFLVFRLVHDLLWGRG